MAEETIEDMQEIEVSSKPARKIKKPMSGLKAGVIGTLTMGPIGPLIGVMQHFRNKSYMERQTAYLDQLDNEQAQIKDILASEDEAADPDERRMIQHARGLIRSGYQALANGDKRGAVLIERAQSALEGIISGDINFRKQEQAAQNQVQRELISNSAKKYRDEYQNTIDAVNGVDHQATKILELVADPNFDPNKPLNKAHLAELLSTSGMMFKDTPDLMDGLAQGVGALNGVAGGVVGGIATMLKSSDFKVTPEDYNRLALNAQKYARIFGDRKASQLGDQASSLDSYGKKLGIVPSDYSLRDYISGAEKELRMSPNPNFTGGHQYKGEPQRTIYRAPAPTESLVSPNVARPQMEYNTSGYPLIKRPTN